MVSSDICTHAEGFMDTLPGKSTLERFDVYFDQILTKEITIILYKKYRLQLHACNELFRSTRHFDGYVSVDAYRCISFIILQKNSPFYVEILT